MKNIYPDYPGVGSLCIKCDFNIYTEDFGPTMSLGKIVDGKWIITKILIAGSAKCSNPDSPMFNKCIVGHLGCTAAKQLLEFSQDAKDMALIGAKKIASMNI